MVDMQALVDRTGFICTQVWKRYRGVTNRLVSVGVGLSAAHCVLRPSISHYISCFPTPGNSLPAQTEACGIVLSSARVTDTRTTTTPTSRSIPAQVERLAAFTRVRANYSTNLLHHHHHITKPACRPPFNPSTHSRPSSRTALQPHATPDTSAL